MKHIKGGIVCILWCGECVNEGLCLLKVTPMEVSCNVDFHEMNPLPH